MAFSFKYIPLTLVISFSLYKGVYSENSDINVTSSSSNTTSFLQSHAVPISLMVSITNTGPDKITSGGNNVFSVQIKLSSSSSVAGDLGVVVSPSITGFQSDLLSGASTTLNVNANIPELESIKCSQVKYICAVVKPDNNTYNDSDTANDEHCFQVSCTTVPSAPGSVSLAATNTTHLKLTWNNPTDGSNVSQYRIQYNETGTGEEWTPIVVAYNSQSGYIQYLAVDKPGANYNVTILAVNGAGEGPAVTKTQDAYPVQPGAITVLNRDTVSIEISWEKAPTGVVSGYSVTATQGSFTFDGGAATATKGTMSGLPSPGTEYNITVKSVSGSLMSTGRIITARTMPAAPSNLQVTSSTATSVHLNWTAAVGVSTGYQVNTSEGSATYSSGTTGQVTSLTAGRCHEFKVFTKRESDTSASSASIEYRTAPNTVTVQTPVVTTSTIVLTWTKPAGDLSGYTIRYKKSDSSSFTNVTVSDPSTVTKILSTGVESGCKYDVQFITMSSVAGSITGCSDSSSMVSFTVITKPSKPVLGTTRDIINNSFHVYWTYGSGCRDKVVVAWGTSLASSSLSNKDNDSSTRDSSEQNLKITPLSHPGGLYHFSVQTKSLSSGAENSDQVSDVVRGTVTLKPNPATGITFPVVTDTNVTVTWTAPTQGQYTKYSVYYNSNSPTSVPKGTTSKTFTGLTPGTQYSFHVKVLSGNAVSSDLAANKQTKPAKPGMIEIVTEETRSITIKWQKSVGVFSSYNVTISPNEGTPGTVVNPTSDYYQWSITGLTPGRQYTLSVVAIQGRIESNPSTEMITTGEEAPSHPQSLKVDSLTDVSVTLTWSDPSHPNGRILHYKISVNGQERNRTTDSTTEYTVSGLIPGTQYTFCLAAVNSAGESNVSLACITDTTKEQPAGQVKVTLSSIMSRSVAASWTYPAIPNGVIVNYVLLVETVGGCVQSFVFNCSNCGDATAPTVSNGSVKTIDSETSKCSSVKNDTANYEDKLGITEFLIMSLKPYTSYTYKVYAVNSKGLGIVDKVVSTTLQDKPDGPPIDIQVVNVSGTINIMITWNQPTTPNGKITDYKINITDVELQNSTIKDVGSNSTEYTTNTGLRAYKNYHVSIQAFTKIGAGPWSTPTTILTSEDAPTAPTALTVVPSSSTSLNITWEAPATPNGIIRSYKITYHIKDESTKKTKEHTDVSSLATTLSNLTKWTTYVVTVEAETIELGPPSSTVEARTNEDVPSGAPKLNSVTNGTEGMIQLLLNWEAPTVPNGILTKYEIEYGISMSGEMKNETKDNSTMIVIDNLKAYTLYYIRIRAYTKVGPGPFNDWKVIRTDQAASDPPENVTITELTHNSANLRWNVPSITKGEITNYEVRIFTIKPEPDTVPVNAQNTTDKDTLNMLVENLLPCTLYYFKVAAYNTKNRGVPAVTHGTTSVNVPGPPLNVKSEATTSTSMTVTWEKPPNETCPINYTVHVYEYVHATSQHQEIVDHRLIRIGYNTVSSTIVNLKKYWEYRFEVTASTSKGFATSNRSIALRTLEDTPGQVASFSIANCSDCYTSMTVRWTPPSIENLHGIITGYRITYQDAGETRMNQSVSNTDREYVIINLRPEIKYYVQIYARTSIGLGESSQVESRILPSGPPIHSITKAKLKELVGNTKTVADLREQAKITLTNEIFSQTNGVIKEYAIIVGQGQFANKSGLISSLGHVTTWAQAIGRDPVPPYQAIKEQWPLVANVGSRKKRSTTSYEVVIGNKDCNKDDTSSYCNGPLNDDVTYCIRIRGFTTKGFTDTPCIDHTTDKNYTGIIVGVVLSIVFLLALAAVLLFFMHRRQMGPFNTKGDDEDGFDDFHQIPRRPSTIKRISIHPPDPRKAPKNRPITIDTFISHVKEMHRDSDYLFSEEYELIRNIAKANYPKHDPSGEMVSKHSWSHAELECNRGKNRYTNILPFDHSRLKLHAADDDEDGTDYINANYMVGYSKRREFIAAQGPLPATIGDFWRMIWEQKVSMIVMVTKCIESGRHKCVQYWPDGDEPVFFDDVIVRVRSQSVLAEYTIKILDVKLNNGSTEETREIRHFHFTAWPDHGCPSSESMLINFVQAVRGHIRPNMESPILVHCSAGVGRTGTFIVVDRLLQHIQNHSEIDIYGIVNEMREYRCNMVQTEDQYIFIHDCMKYALENVNNNEDDQDEVDDVSEHLYDNMPLKEIRTSTTEVHEEKSLLD